MRIFLNRVFAAKLACIVREPEWISALALFRRRSLEAWLEVFERDDVCVGPVATLAEAQTAFGTL